MDRLKAESFFAFFAKSFSLCFMLLHNLRFSAKHSSICGLVKKVLKLNGKGIVYIFLFLGPYWHKLPQMALFCWTLFLHTCISPIDKQGSALEIACPDGYAYRLSAEDLPEARSAEGLKQNMPAANNGDNNFVYYIACEDFDAYMESRDRRYIFTHANKATPGGPSQLNARSQHE